MVAISMASSQIPHLISSLSLSDLTGHSCREHSQAKIKYLRWRYVQGSRTSWSTQKPIQPRWQKERDFASWAAGWRCLTAGDEQYSVIEKANSKTNAWDKLG